MFLNLSEARTMAAAVREYAEKPERLYVPAPGAVVPGTDPGHVMESGEHRVVFSLTKGADGTVYRHMSVSLIGAAPGRFPSPPAVFTLATMLGFTGGFVERGVTLRPGDDWGMDAQIEEGEGGQGQVVAVQPVVGGT